jgi:hypothetical protein
VLVDGDSGSWVVTEDTQQVIGHVVATDPLGAGYIIPLCDIFDDIQNSLGVLAVGLPSVEDIEAAEFRTEQDMVHYKKLQDFLGIRDEDRPLRDSIKATARAQSTSPIRTASFRPPTPEEDNMVQVVPKARDQKTVRWSTFDPTPPQSSTSSNSSRGSRRREKSPDITIRIGGKTFSVGENGLELISRPRDQKKEEPLRSGGFVVVEERPAVRRPRFAGSYSKDDTMSHDSGYSSYSGSSSNSPNYMDSDLTSDAIDISSNRPRALRSGVQVVVDEPPRSISDIRMDRIEARIMAANAAIAARPAVPPPPRPRRVRGSVATDAPEKRGRKEMIERALQDAVEHVRGFDRNFKTERTPNPIREEEGEDEDEEVQRQRLRERLVPKRRVTAGPESRRQRVLCDDGVYRWE